MSEGRKACVVLTLKDDGSFEVMDANGEVFHAQSTDDLGEACAAILADDDLPEMTAPSAMQVQLERVAGQAAEAFATRAGTAGKALAPLVQPMLRGASNGVVRMRRRHEANERQQERDKADMKSRKDRRLALIKRRGAS